MRTAVFWFCIAASTAAQPQTAATNCRPGPDDDIRCRTLLDDGSSIVRTYRPNPFGASYQADSHVKKPLRKPIFDGRPTVDPLPPRPPMPPARAPASRTTETWVKPTRPSPRDGFLK
ncbi:MAG: hypothetical protein U9Q71_10755 [Pseudomonadota bacterium]|nr:hypothetical protein [Pseudomonadota bacterium]